MIEKITFKGIVKPYTNPNGYHIIPIAQNPNQNDIEKAIEATKIKKAHSGLNGRAYFYGEDLVVKKYLNPDEACNYNPNREIDSLDLMYEAGIKSPNIQEGKFAFTTPENEVYLVSSKIQGQNANPTTNKFNLKNLYSLVDTICELDKPKRYDAQTQDARRFRRAPIIFPYQVPMHYDLAIGNFNITEERSGIFDFEYLQMEDLNDKYFRMKNGYHSGTLSNLSDIPGIISNLRNFEYRGLLTYIDNLEQSERLEFFTNYLSAKSEYHKNRALYFYSELKKFPHNPELEDLALKEAKHSYLLSEPTKDIIKAEAIKIQITSFIYKQSQFDRSSKSKINPAQIINYIEYANRFFNEKSRTSQTQEEREYFEDCKLLMNSWNGVINWMQWQEKFHTIEDFLPFKKTSAELTAQELDFIEKKVEETNNYRTLFLSKITDEKIPTLDEILGL